MHKFNFKRLSIVVLFFVSITNFGISENIKIGIPMNVNSVTGDFYGYAYDYFQEISKYTGWNYIYDYCSSEDLISDFKNGKVDFISEVLFFDDSNVIFSRYPVFELDYHLFYKISNNGIDPLNSKSLNGKRVGVVSNSYSQICAESYLKANLLNLDIVEFNSEEQLNDAFFSDENDLDLICTADYYIAGKKDIISIAELSKKDLYIIFPSSKANLANQFNQAQKKLMAEKPHFVRNLKEKYYEFSNTLREENSDIQKWLHEHDEIKIGYVEDWYPFCYSDSISGDVKGLLPCYMEKVLENLYLSNLNVKYISYENYDKAICGLKENKVDVMFPLYGDYNEAEHHEIQKSDEIYALTMDLVYDGSDELQKIHSIVCNKNAGVYKIYCEKYLNSYALKEVDANFDDKLTKVIRTQNSAFLINRINSEILSKQREFKRFNKMELPEKCPISFGLRRDDIGLLNLLDIGISEVEYGYVTSKINEIAYLNKGYSFFDYLKDNMIILFFILLCFVFMIIAVLIIYIRTIQQNKLKLLKSKKEVDAALLQAETANLSKSMFLNNMSHDIRTPMNAIIGFTNLAKRSLSDPKKTSEYLSKIEVSSNHLLDLINDVLDMSRIESGKLVFNITNENLIDIANGMKTIFQADIERKKFNFVLDTSTIKHPNVLCDRLRLNQILLNLLGNSVKFTPEEGKISLIINELESSKSGYATIQIIVSDTGIGMSEEFLERIFEAFEREQTSTISKIQGTGLGMAITKRIVEMLNGTIAVESEKGKGSTFTICIDFEIYDDVESSNSSKSSVIDDSGFDTSIFKGKRILLAEDNELNQEIARTVLEELGFTVFVAYDGELAYKMVKDCEPGTFSLILMDIQMPVMNGYEATCAIRELDDPDRSGIPIIAMTANAFNEDKQMTIDAGMNDHISKPFNLDDLKRTLMKFMV